LGQNDGKKSELSTMKDDAVNKKGNKGEKRKRREWVDKAVAPRTGARR
jgi:hypothetical protein